MLEHFNIERGLLALFSLLYANSTISRLETFFWTYNSPQKWSNHSSRKMPVSPTLTELNRELNRIRANDLCNINAVLYRVTGLSSLLGEYNYTRMMG